MTTNLPASVSPSTLPVERLLTQPSPDATALVRLITDPLALVRDKKGDVVRASEDTVWILNNQHPLASDAKIVRMYRREDGGVEVYSSDGKMFVRTVVPERVIRFLDEAMSEEMFVEFIDLAESGEDELDPEPEPEPEPEPMPAQAAGSGAAS